jgi:predicted 2-oxoglutarate/Fe(II)-dependent dioxygenase YbiX
VPRAEFFRNFNLFVLKNFLDRTFCETLIRQIESRSLERSQLTRGLDEKVRRSQDTALFDSLGPLVRSKLRELKLDIERHFNLALDDCEHPQFISYGVGDFFSPHLDSSTSPDVPEFIHQRRISIVVFLNDKRNGSAKHEFDGGDLTFYGLMTQPEFVNCPLPVTPESGLLVGFPSNTIHEVRPVVSGRRFSIASWYYAS